VPSLSEESAPEETSPEAVSHKSPKKTVAEGRLVVPPHWPKWKKRCGAKKKGKPDCRSWAVVGMPTCKFHGSGGVAHRARGELRYLAWVALGAREGYSREMPIDIACRTSLAMFAEYIFSDERNEADIDTQIKAALWLIDVIKSP
jgi:hypothetical protein